MAKITVKNYPNLYSTLVLFLNFTSDFKGLAGELEDNYLSIKTTKSILDKAEEQAKKFTPFQVMCLCFNEEEWAVEPPGKEYHEVASLLYNS